MKIRIEVKSLSETCGNFRYYASCPLSKAILMVNPVKKCFNKDVLELLAKEGVKIEYIGRKTNFLDELGAKHVEE